MSTLAASITSYFVQQTANMEFKELTDRLDRIESILALAVSAGLPASEKEVSRIGGMPG